MLTTLICLLVVVIVGSVCAVITIRSRQAEIYALEQNLDDAYSFKRDECQKRDDKIASLERNESALQVMYRSKLDYLKAEHSLRIANYQRQSLATCAQYATDANEFISIPAFSETTRELVDTPIKYGQANFQTTKLSKPKNVRASRTSVPDSGRKPRAKREIPSKPVRNTKRKSKS